METKKQSPVLIILAFLAIYIIWGTTYLAILFGLEGFPPFLLSAIRFTVAGAALFGWCLIKKEKLPRGKDLRVAIISGIVMLVGGSGLVTWCEQYIPSGQAAVLVATEPFMFLLLDKKRWQFYLSQKMILFGLLLGFGGIALFFLYNSSTGTEVQSHLKIWATAVLFGSAVLWVIGSLYSKTKEDREVSNTTTTGIQLLAAGVFSFLLSLITGELPKLSWDGITAKAWGGLAYLIVMGSIIAYLAFTWLLTVRPPAQVSTHTYVNPVVAIVMGALMADESISTVQVIGLMIILLGVFLTNKKVSHA